MKVHIVYASRPVIYLSRDIEPLTEVPDDIVERFTNAAAELADAAQTLENVYHTAKQEGT